MVITLTNMEVEEAVKQYIQRELGVETSMTGVCFYTEGGEKYTEIGGVDVFVSGEVMDNEQ